MRIWEKLAESGVYSVDDFRQAAYTLVTRQVLYGSDRNSALAYRIVHEHIEQFKDVFGLLGIQVQHNPVDRFVAAIPRLEPRYMLSADMTLLILTLRSMYDARAADIDPDNGQVLVTIDELRNAYRAAANRDLPDQVGALKAMLLQAGRMGMCSVERTADGSIQPFDVAILPAIVALVSQPVLRRMLGRWSDKPARDNETESDEAAA